MEGSTTGMGPWAAEPGAVGGLLLLAGLYLVGLRRALRAGARPRWRDVLLVTVGWLALVAALVTPLHPAGEQLVSAHMAQHALLILAPLALVAGRAGTRVLQALAPTWRGQVVRSLRPWRVRWFTSTLSLVALLLVTVLVWHLPSVFQLAAEVGWLHALEHMSLVAVSALFWGRVVGTGRSRPSRAGPALASVFALFVGGAVAGTLLIFSAVPLYPGYVERAAALGVDWMADQQLAGVLMSGPMGMAAVGMAAWLAWRWVEARGPLDRPGGESLPAVPPRRE